MHEAPMEPIRTLTPPEGEQGWTQEWLVTNGLGGYASGAVSGLVTRRYHGLLVAALPSPHGRTVVLNHLWEMIEAADGSREALSDAEGARRLLDFRLERGLPVWRFAFDGVVIEKRLVMSHQQNTTHLIYALVEGQGPFRLELQPWFHARGHEDPVDRPVPDYYRVQAQNGRFEVHLGNGIPPVKLQWSGGRPRFNLDAGSRVSAHYPVEAERGYASMGQLWSPGVLRATLTPDCPVCLTASTEPWHVVQAMTADEARHYELERRRRLIAIAHPALRVGPAAELVLAADGFIFVPAGRVADQARARSVGDEVRSVIAGYHWFTDWGRDTMISLEGLALVTGRATEAGWILRTFAHYVKDGLIPNMFPEGRAQGLYHTADATLWFFHAVNRYLRASGDRHTLRVLLPTLKAILQAHRQGTRFGIRVDPADGLLRQGEEGYQLTWMDAKVEDWVVTPRRGKAVELNALWYNALCLLRNWVAEEEGEAPAEPLADAAAECRASFNRRFWNPADGCLYDVVDGEAGDDAAIRPNQIFALSLDHPVLDRERWEPVLDTVRRELLTPVGLRSLARGHPDYKARYFGDLRARDAAYHQGTVWGWLMGPYVDAWLKLHPDDRAGARHLLEQMLPHLGEFGVGWIAEVFDGDPPFSPRGCVAQAWSVAEWLRCWVDCSE